MELSHLRRIQAGCKQAKMVKFHASLTLFEHFDIYANRNNDIMLSRKNKSRLFAT